MIIIYVQKITDDLIEASNFTKFFTEPLLTWWKMLVVLVGWKFLLVEPWLVKYHIPKLLISAPVRRSIEVFHEKSVTFVKFKKNLEEHTDLLQAHFPPFLLYSLPGVRLILTGVLCVSYSLLEPCHSHENKLKLAYGKI